VSGCSVIGVLSVIAYGRFVSKQRDCAERKRAYLCARPALTGFYERLGWTPIERDVGEHGLTVFIQDAPGVNVRISSPP
jgi:hypothetical protein